MFTHAPQPPARSVNHTVQVLRSRDQSDIDNAKFSQAPNACSNCSMRTLCLPQGLSAREIEQVDALTYTHKRISRGESLYRSRDKFESLYAIRSGFFKTSVLSEDGREQVTGFHMAGDMLGLEGIGNGEHGSDAIAIEDAEVCIIPFHQYERLSRSIEPLQHHLHQVMSREITRDYSMMLLLGTMRAEERLASFLLNLSERFTQRGYSPREFILRMTRDEIGSFLGLKLETVSRMFSRFHDEGLINTQQKHISILDVEGLKHVIGRCD